MRSSPLVLALAAAAIGLPASPAAAAHTLNVSKTGTATSCSQIAMGSPTASLVGALECAVNGDTIRVGAGRFTGLGVVNANVTVVGAGSQTVIAHPAGGQEPTLAISSGRRVQLRGLTIDGGDGFGPGIAAGGGALTLNGVRITNGSNIGHRGGGIAIDAPSATTTLTIVNSTIDGNHSDVGGGGLSVKARGKVAIDNSTISGNRADGADNGTGGGGIEIVGEAALELRRSTVTGNQAQRGGGLWATSSAPGDVTVVDSIVAGNTARPGTGADCAAGAPRHVSGHHNLIGQNSGSAPSGCAGLTDGETFNQVGTAISPIDPVLGPLAANGGLTPTHALRPGSPAIGTGDPVDCDATPNARRDQRGKARNASARMACDIGAYDTTGTPVQTLDVRATARTEPTCATASYTKPFRTLDAALACARNGALIRLGAGRYSEAVSVPVNVTLAGAGAATVIDHPDDGSTQPTVAIAPGRWVTLKTLVVDGNGGFATAVSAGEGVLTLNGARVTGGQDVSGRGGGGISVDALDASTAVRVSNSTVDHNFSDVAGGGILLNGGARGLAVTIDNSTISGNTADGSDNGTGGGAIELRRGTLALRRSTITGNHAQRGGGLHGTLNLGDVTLVNTILAGNTARVDAPDCSLRSSRQAISLGHNLIGENSGVAGSGCVGLTDGTKGDQVGTPGHAIAPGLAALAANGGPAPTHALNPSSPARSAGDPLDCSAYPFGGLDQRGFPRNASERGTCDIGAYDTGA